MQRGLVSRNIGKMDILANALSNIMSAEATGKRECIAGVSSKTLKGVLTIMKDNYYIGDFQEINDEKGGKVVINLIGKINNTGVIKPRFAVKLNEYKKYEERFLPAQNFGLIVVSTSHGLITHREAKEKKIGGKLISFVY